MGKAKVTDLGGGGCLWQMTYSVGAIGSVLKRPRIRFIDFRATSTEEAMHIVLGVLKRSFKNMKNISERAITVIAIPVEPLPGEECVSGSDLIRLRANYRNKKLLRVSDPSVALIRGYGPKVWRVVTGQ